MEKKKVIKDKEVIDVSRMWWVIRSYDPFLENQRVGNVLLIILKTFWSEYSNFI